MYVNLGHGVWSGHVIILHELFCLNDFAGCVIAKHCDSGDSLEIEKWQNSTHRRIKTPEADCHGWLGRRGTRRAKFGANPSTKGLMGEYAQFSTNIFCISNILTFGDVMLSNITFYGFFAVIEV